MINNLFAVHLLNQHGKQSAEFIAAAFSKLLEDLSTVCSPDTREFSLVKTKLEEASFFAKKAMAIAPENQETA